MDPIHDIADLTRGDVIHHPALGFAIVDRVEPDSARLYWESNGSRLPPMVSAELLAKGYRRCVPGGFLFRSVVDKASLRALVDGSTLVGRHRQCTNETVCSQLGIRGHGLVRGLVDC